MADTLKAAQARIAELEAKLAGKRNVSVKHNAETGTVNIYGIRARFPVSLYPGEWAIVFANADAVKAECKVAAPIAEKHRADK